MRVLFVLDGLQTGGAELNVVALIGALERLGVSSALCTLTAANDGFLGERFSQLSAHRFNLGAAKIYDLRAWSPFVRLVRRERIDVVHIQDPYAAILGFWASRAGVPVTFTRHVLTDPRRQSIWDRLRAEVIEAAIRHSAGRIIAVSEAVADDFSRATAIPRKRFSIVNNGIDIPNFDESERAGIRQRLHWPPQSHVILMAAVMRPGKGHLLAINAFAEIKRRLPQSLLVFAGDGPLRPAIEAACSGLDRAVRFLGEVTNVPELMAASDILILPSDTEAFPNVLLEAAVSGLPSVATRVGGIPEIIAHGETGLCIPPQDSSALADAVVSILSDRCVKMRMGQNARERGRRRFTIETQAKATLEIYRDLIGRKAGR